MPTAVADGDTSIMAGRLEDLETDPWITLGPIVTEIMERQRSLTRR
jgi:hypothetical protein